MEAISPNLIAAEPGVSAIAAALEAAAARADDTEARVRGSAVALAAGLGRGVLRRVLDRVVSLLRRSV